MAVIKPIRNIILWSVVAVIIIIGIGAVWGYLLERASNSPGSHAEQVKVNITAGSGIQKIADKLYSVGVIDDRKVFVFAIWWNGNSGPLMAGEYLFPAYATPREIINILSSGETVNYRLTVPEGLTSREIVELIKQTKGLQGKIVEAPPEGTLLPETYFFRRGDIRNNLVERMDIALKDLMEKLWRGRSSNLPLDTIEEAVILASIVEKETGLTNERGKIAGVFINRLMKNMKLQSDPTVIYAITEGLVTLNRSLLREDLKINSPFNTYMHKGLPPRPISNPGRASIEAVLNPTDTDALYFVASPKGGHVFATTLAQHNKNVSIWRKYRNSDKSGRQK